MVVVGCSSQHNQTKDNWEQLRVLLGVRAKHVEVPSNWVMQVCLMDVHTLATEEHAADTLASCIRSATFEKRGEKQRNMSSAGMATSRDMKD